MEEEKAHNLYALFSSVDAGARQKRVKYKSIAMNGVDHFYFQPNIAYSDCSSLAGSGLQHWGAGDVKSTIRGCFDVCVFEIQSDA